MCRIIALKGPARAENESRFVTGSIGIVCFVYSFISNRILQSFIIFVLLPKRSGLIKQPSAWKLNQLHQPNESYRPHSIALFFSCATFCVLSTNLKLTLFLTKTYLLSVDNI